MKRGYVHRVGYMKSDNEIVIHGYPAMSVRVEDVVGWAEINYDVSGVQDSHQKISGIFSEYSETCTDQSGTSGDVVWDKDFEQIIDRIIEAL